MKIKLVKSNQWAYMAALLLCAAGVVTANAASTIITFSVDMATNIAAGTFVPGTDTISVHGAFNGWGAGVNLVQQGSGTVYTNTLNDTTDANGGNVNYKFVDSNAGVGNGGYENLATGQNRAALLPTTSGASLVLPTPYFNDAGAPITSVVSFQVDVSQQIALGNFTPGSSYVEVRGLFNGWTGGVFLLTNNPNIMVTNQYGLVTSNVWVGWTNIVGSPACVEAFKYVVQPGTQWESPGAANSDGGGNRYFFNVPQTLPIVNFSDSPYAPLSTNVFSVDMSVQAYYGNWNSSESVDLAGSFNNWSTGSTPMTNNPTAANPNVYYATVVLGEGSTPQYKFTYQGTGGTAWENPTGPTLGGNRFFTVPLSPTNTLATVFFSDLNTNDLLASNVLVTFTINMTGASQYPSGTPFNPGTDSVFVNSPNFTGAWLGWDPISLAGYVLTNNPVGSMIYQGTFMVPMGQPNTITYKYGIDGSDNEAASGNNHGRVARSIATGAYALPTDTFNINPYNEPYFGQLVAGPASGGKVPISWLGAPNVTLQTSTSLAGGGGWLGLPVTSGVYWSAGNNSTNGLVSVTNFPASGKMFFRLLKN